MLHRRQFHIPMFLLKHSVVFVGKCLWRKELSLHSVFWVVSFGWPPSSKDCSPYICLCRDACSGPLRTNTSIYYVPSPVDLSTTSTKSPIYNAQHVVCSWCEIELLLGATIILFSKKYASVFLFLKVILFLNFLSGVSSLMIDQRINPPCKQSSKPESSFCMRMAHLFSDWDESASHEKQPPCNFFWPLLSAKFSPLFHKEKTKALSKNCRRRHHTPRHCNYVPEATTASNLFLEFLLINFIKTPFPETSLG